MEKVGPTSRESERVVFIRRGEDRREYQLATHVALHCVLNIVFIVTYLIAKTGERVE